MTDTGSPPTVPPRQRSWAKVKVDSHGDLSIELYERSQNGRLTFLAKVLIHQKGRTRTTMIVTGPNIRDVEETIREHYVFYRIGRLRSTRG